MKKALLIGINYLRDPNNQLYGCINDAIQIRNYLIDVLGYKEEDITLLRDDMPDLLPTGKRIITELIKLVNDSFNCSELFFHYSGHGTNIADTNGDEIDGRDECIVPSDYKSGIITDDLLFEIIKGVRCRLIVLMDSCHSGSVLDLQNSYSYDYTKKDVSFEQNSRKEINNPNIIMFSGCRDTEYSMDSYFDKYNMPMGVLTHSVIEIMRKNKVRPLGVYDFYCQLCEYIKSKNYPQRSLCSISSTMSMDEFKKIPLLIDDIMETEEIIRIRNKYDTDIQNLNENMNNMKIQYESTIIKLKEEIEKNKKDNEAEIKRINDQNNSVIAKLNKEIENNKLVSELTVKNIQNKLIESLKISDDKIKASEETIKTLQKNLETEKNRNITLINDAKKASEIKDITMNVLRNNLTNANRVISELRLQLLRKK
jgi:hypothetical protein